ncbi:Chitin-bind-1 domain containing protein [Pyrenophora tritici-repentis]|nr:Chitin-bind-1 domain containing protein [Pyrenophora tritici-repentis]
MAWSVDFNSGIGRGLGPINTTDGTCGNMNGNTVCGSWSTGSCCSSSGWCGTDAAYCGSGCQSGDYNNSSRTTDRTYGSKYKDKTCGSWPQGGCCSASGFCDSSEAYCGVGCQSGCDSPAPGGGGTTAIGGVTSVVGGTTSTTTNTITAVVGGKTTVINGKTTANGGTTSTRFDGSTTVIGGKTTVVGGITTSSPSTGAITTVIGGTTTVIGAGGLFTTVINGTTTIIGGTATSSGTSTNTEVPTSTNGHCTGPDCHDGKCTDPEECSTSSKYETCTAKYIVTKSVYPDQDSTATSASTSTTCYTITACTGSATTYTTTTQTATTIENLCAPTSCGRACKAAERNRGVMPTAVPQLDSSGNIDMLFDLSNTTIAKRHIPDDGSGDWTDWYNDLREDANTIKINNNDMTGGTETSWVRVKWGNGPQNILVDHLTGCAVVIAVSRLGAFFAHIWESETLKKGQAEFDRDVIGPLK